MNLNSKVTLSITLLEGCVYDKRARLSDLGGNLERVSSTTDKFPYHKGVNPNPITVCSTERPVMEVSVAHVQETLVVMHPAHEDQRGSIH